MNARILGILLLTGTLAAVVLSPSFRSSAASDPVQVAPPGSNVTAAKIEVVFVLDTTGSMGGLIAAAKEKIWSIATTMAQATPAPEISMGLVAYRDRGDAYVTKTVDLSADLDSVYAALMDFGADGGGDGAESVNEALDDAVTRLSWSSDPTTYRVLFLVGDAPPHMDYQDDRKYPDVVAAATARGIVVNTIQCGSLQATVAPFRRIAALGGGRYFQVAQAGGAVEVETPFDARIAELSAALDATRMYYGGAEAREAIELKAAATEKLAASASPAARARRGIFNATASGAVNFAGDGDLVSDVASGRVDLAALPEAELPPALEGLTDEARTALVQQTAADRDRLQRQIRALAERRDAFIREELEKRGGAAGSLDVQIYEAVRAQGAAKGLRYESGAKF
jgi:hypothetical protein